MVRRRKIPARKHHGVRDPLKQIEEREKRQKNVTNNPPEKDGDQKVTYKFSQFKKLMDATKAGKKFKKNHIGHEDIPKTVAANKSKTTVITKKIKNIKQFEDEADEDYLKRVNRITTESLREAQYEAKYGVQVIRDPNTGAITIKKKPKNEIDELLKQKQKERRIKNTNKKTSKVKLPDKQIVKELIKQTIKDDAQQEKGELKEFNVDTFRFGEVVHGPPNLSALPRKAERSETVPRPGKKNNLLLKSILTGTTSENQQDTLQNSQKLNIKKPKLTKSKLQGKRRDLPVGTRSMIEGEQAKLIELYRNLKKPKTKSLK